MHLQRYIIVADKASILCSCFVRRLGFAQINLVNTLHSRNFADGMIIKAANIYEAIKGTYIE